MARGNYASKVWFWALAGLWLLGWITPGQAQDSAWETATTAGLQALEQQRYQAAIAPLQAALAIAETWPPMEPRVVASMMHLAMAYDKQGQDKRAEALYQRALTLQERLYGLEHTNLLEILDAAIALQQKMHPVQSLLPWSLANRLANRARRIRDREERAFRQEFPGWWNVDERHLLGEGGA